jgi:hypothetical protein
MQGNAKSFLKAVLLGFGLALLVLGTALAMTPAGTQIQNQASASYIDSAGQPRTTTSNLVVTVVQQVYSFTITPDGTESAPGQIKAALPGGQVVFNYVVTNTGNGTDTINLSPVQGTADNFDLGSPTHLPGCQLQRQPGRRGDHAHHQRDPGHGPAGLRDRDGHHSHKRQQ